MYKKQITSFPWIDKTPINLNHPSCFVNSRKIIKIIHFSESSKLPPLLSRLFFFQTIHKQKIKAKNYSFSIRATFPQLLVGSTSLFSAQCFIYFQFWYNVKQMAREKVDKSFLRGERWLHPWLHTLILSRGKNKWKPLQHKFMIGITNVPIISQSVENVNDNK